LLDSFLQIAVEVSSDIDWNDDAPVFAEATNQIDREFVTLQDCLDLYTSSEKLSSDEGWYCSKCKTHVPASKKVDLWRLGPIVALNLKRFHFQDGRAVKISTPVQFPLTDLQLSSFLPHAVPSYDLFATLDHHGIAGYGHYTANVCDSNQQWWNCDDDMVSKISADEVVSKSAYVLLYRRREN
jgi:ubiquitin C-terminal hydrolase